MRRNRNIPSYYFGGVSQLLKEQNIDGRLTLTVEVTENKMAKTTNLFKYILVVLAILLSSLPPLGSACRLYFCILDNLLIQVCKRSGTTHWFVAVVLQILIVFIKFSLIGRKRLI